jgi:prepilin-type N-terminal cleavage/methylation domain-containing protein
MTRGERRIGRSELCSARAAHAAGPIIRHRSSFINSKAFTLIELLVVTAVIALLMAILLPALQRARRQSKAVICQAHLKQWGHILAMYTGENEGYFPYGSGIAPIWLFRGPMPLEEGDSALRLLAQPIPTDGIRCCPMAMGPPIEGGGTRVRFPVGPRGEYFEASWSSAGTPSGTWKAIRPEPTFLASYGFNRYLFESTNRLVWDRGVRRVPRATNVFSVRAKGAVPVLLDSTCPDELVQNSDDPPNEEGVIGPRPGNHIAAFCLNRHNGHVGSLFLDWSVRKVGLKELWTLKWYEQFDTRGRWTRAGGVQPEDWPEWMRNFKDY